MNETVLFWSIIMLGVMTLFGVILFLNGIFEIISNDGIFEAAAQWLLADPFNRVIAGIVLMLPFAGLLVWVKWGLKK